MRKIRYSAVAAAGLLALALAFPAYGKDKEEREPVGQISLRISSDIGAGEDGDVDVEVDVYKRQGSSTQSPGSVLIRIIRSSSSTGF